MKRFFWLLFLIIFFAACGDSKPKGIFSEKKMTNILFDLHLADGYASYLPFDTVNKNINYYLSVYENYDTDSAEVKKNLDYYASHPQDLQEIYAAISKRLQGLGDDFRKVEEEKYREIARQDSIRTKLTMDSLNYVKRDTMIHFNAKRDLFVHIPDSLKDSLYVKGKWIKNTKKKAAEKIKTPAKSTTAALEKAKTIKEGKDSLLAKDINTKDSLSLNKALSPAVSVKMKDALWTSIINAQRYWEMTFSYFGTSNFNRLLSASPESVKAEGAANAETNSNVNAPLVKIAPEVPGNKNSGGKPRRPTSNPRELIKKPD